MNIHAILWTTFTLSVACDLLLAVLGLIPAGRGACFLGGMCFTVGALNTRWAWRRK